VLEQLDPDVLEASRRKHLFPGLGPRRLLPAPRRHARRVLQDPDDTRGAALQYRHDLLEHEPPVA